MENKNKIKMLMIGAGIIVIFLLLLKSNILKNFERQPNETENLTPTKLEKFPVENNNLNLPNLNVNTPAEYLMLYTFQMPAYSNSGQGVCPLTKYSTNNTDLLDKLRGL
ncbi:MAG TPA: hypothetical protein ENI61_04185 [Ignavibacteria bacterium]|nr:hypothetical protein [Ignavibacteria bacterium]